MIKVQGFVTKELKLKTLTLLEILSIENKKTKVNLLVINENLREKSNFENQFILASGHFEKSKSNNFTEELIVSNYKIITEGDSPFELNERKFKGDLITKLNNRSHSLKLKEEKDKFLYFSRFMNNLRNYFFKNNYIEVMTPKIMGFGSEGGSSVFKFNYFGKQAYLAQSPQLYKQQIILAGFPKIFETNFIYRAEPSDTPRHLMETYCLDVELICKRISNESKLKQILKEVKNFLINCSKFESKAITKDIFTEITYTSAIEKLQNLNYKIVFGDDISNTHIQLLRQNKQFLIITHYPCNLRPFYIKRKDKNITYSFDVFDRNWEIISGGVREETYIKLKKNLDAHDINSESLEPYLNSFGKKGIPHGGFGLGLQRLVTTILGYSNIRELSFFCRDINRLTP